MLKDTTRSRYQCGQVWSYKTRPGEAGSTLTVVKVESHPKLGVIVHVRLDGLNIPNPSSASGRTTAAGHLPFAEKAIDDSVLQLLRTGPVPDGYREGYDLWRGSFDQGKAGIFDVSVAKAVDYVGGAMKPGNRVE